MTERSRAFPQERSWIKHAPDVNSCVFSLYASRVTRPDIRALPNVSLKIRRYWSTVRWRWRNKCSRTELDCPTNRESASSPLYNTYTQTSYCSRGGPQSTAKGLARCTFAVSLCRMQQVGLMSVLGDPNLHKTAVRHCITTRLIGQRKLPRRTRNLFCGPCTLCVNLLSFRAYSAGALLCRHSSRVDGLSPGSREAKVGGRTHSVVCRSTGLTPSHNRAVARIY